MMNCKNPFKNVKQELGHIVDFMSVGVRREYIDRRLGSRIADIAFGNIERKGY